MGIGVGGVGTEEGEERDERGRWWGSHCGSRAGSSGGNTAEAEGGEPSWVRDNHGWVAEEGLWRGATNDRARSEREWETGSEEWDREELDGGWGGSGGGGRRGRRRLRQGGGRGLGGDGLGVGADEGGEMRMRRRRRRRTAE